MTSSNQPENDITQSGGPGLRASDEDASLPDGLVPTIFAFWRQTGGEYWVTTAGTSMWPLIIENDRLLLTPSLTRVRQGDIVVFLQNGELIAHRVLRVLEGSQTRFVTKGDNTSYFDSPVSADDVFGHVLAIQRDDYIMALDCRKWRIIGRCIATLTLAVAISYAWARAVKWRFWGNSPLPGIRLGRKLSAVLMAKCMKLFLHFLPFHHIQK